MPTAKANLGGVGFAAARKISSWIFHCNPEQDPEERWERQLNATFKGPLVILKSLLHLLYGSRQSTMQGATSEHVRPGQTARMSATLSLSADRLSSCR